MGKKYFTLSFDDGLEQDKRVLDLMKKYGLKGTFNLNSGMFGPRLKADIIILSCLNATLPFQSIKHTPDKTT